ncbi:TerC/Alx family metal homeostasis membrane protein [Pseudoduganella sp. FT93W]|uniref:TerC/Alx family metal homeostasis membrane protein n=1 Tax=Duganella fentianensis TaxID=2692177 RepID=A0A845HVG5_9BURK|nr:TerC family protein [Duganella fentianensis]MYN45003.1 TerC/Alx family metal homeostasis membrane protein [Duganella fentianensis]
MTGTEHIGSTALWAGFVAFVLLMLAVDLWVFGGNKSEKVTARAAGAWSLGWFGLALAFNGGLWWYLQGSVGAEIAGQKSLEFLSGYLIEKALSVDNIFIFLLIFSAFQVKPEYQRRVLIYGVLGAIIMRAIMILAGAWVVSEFSWVLYLFGAFLLYTGVKMFRAVDHQPDVRNNPVLRFARRYLPVAEGEHGEKFVIWKDGKRYVTPLLLVLILIEATDLVFAVDSIPAIFAITSDPFIVFTSNMFAILGLRALYFLLADIAGRFHLLKYGLALVLCFIGLKMLLLPWLHIPVHISLSVVAALIAASVLASLYVTRNN